MTTYLVSYDLRSPSRKYEALYAKLKSYTAWARITESTWAIVTSHSATQVRDALRRTVDADDRVFVIQSGQEAAWLNPMCSGTWLQQRL